jgi:hypothetical protein
MGTVKRDKVNQRGYVQYQANVNHMFFSYIKIKPRPSPILPILDPNSKGSNPDQRNHIKNTSSKCFWKHLGLPWDSAPGHKGQR